MTNKNYDPYYAKDGSNTAASLRDKFAMSAMQGDLASQDENTGYYENSTPDECLTARAEFYYRMADAMLKAREK
ncbi:hypothetical protein [Morganella morganii]|uniref:hypothetical protein n=1 Tax=Morganella morganii TaxID=582 RepID=UPI001BDAF0CB|nr:hypothetical protein [Morganella morganii]MBT0306024.1 hypothetical protein [Morganella morganii subsp. morganii]